MRTTARGSQLPAAALQPVLFDEPYVINRLGRDEMNLTDHAFWIVDERRDPRDEVRYGEGEFYWEARGKDYGLPTTVDLDFFVVMLEVSREQNWPDQVCFSQHDVAVRRRKRTDNGREYERLQLFLDRMRGITIKAQRIRLNGRWKHDASFGIMTNYSLISYEDRCHENNWCMWNPLLLASFRSGKYLKDLDVDFFLDLEVGWAKVLYRYLDRRASGDGKPTYTESLPQLAFRLGMEASRLTRSQILQRLELGHRELKAKGFLHEWYCPPTARGVPAQITYQFGPRTTYYARQFALGRPVPAHPAAPAPAVAAPAGPPTTQPLALDEEHGELIRQMGEYGLGAPAARALIKKHGADRCRQLHMEWMPRYQATQKVDTPYKFLSSAIARGFDPPEETKAQKAEKGRREKAAREREQREREAAEEQKTRQAALDFQSWWAEQDEDFRGRIRTQAIQNVMREHAKVLEPLQEKGKLQTSALFEGLLEPELRRLSGWKHAAAATASGRASA